MDCDYIVFENCITGSPLRYLKTRLGQTKTGQLVIATCNLNFSSNSINSNYITKYEV